MPIWLAILLALIGIALGALAHLWLIPPVQPGVARVQLVCEIVP